jgi:hypothetical protein
LPIANCRLPIFGDAAPEQIGNWQSEIGNVHDSSTKPS